jgi:hypothetical protein
LFTHESGQKLVKDLISPLRFMLQKLAVSILDAGHQFHVEVVVENAHNVNAWKEFSKEIGIENYSITKLQASHGDRGY